MGSSDLIRRLPSRRSRPGPASPRTELSVTRLGPCPCTLQVPLWRQQLGSGSWRIERWTSHWLHIMEPTARAQISPAGLPCPARRAQTDGEGGLAVKLRKGKGDEL